MRQVGRTVMVLNTRGGQGLIDNYLGPNSGGTGTLTTFAAQYDLSLARLLRYPEVFEGDGPDIFLSLFGIQTKVASNDPAFDGITKRKFGAMGSYSLLPWLAATIRYDNVSPNTADRSQAFAVISPAVIFRTGWQAHDQIALQSRTGSTARTPTCAVRATRQSKTTPSSRTRTWSRSPPASGGDVQRAHQNPKL